MMPTKIHVSACMINYPMILIHNANRTENSSIILCYNVFVFPIHCVGSEVVWWQ